MIEYERTYLAKYVPTDLGQCRSKEIIDVYIPVTSERPKLRLRKNGDNYEMTKKQPVTGKDSSEQEEQTIILTEEEFKALAKIEGKKVHKIRYVYPFNGGLAEIDVFQGPLKGLVLIDVEFPSREENDAFAMPDFCLSDVTQEKTFAGGMLCGKSLDDIKHGLDRYGYKVIMV